MPMWYVHIICRDDHLASEQENISLVENSGGRPRAVVCCVRDSLTADTQFTYLRLQGS